MTERAVVDLKRERGRWSREGCSEQSGNSVNVSSNNGNIDCNSAVAKQHQRVVRTRPQR